MDKNTFIWSCGRWKYVQIMAKPEYRERLVCKLNSVWFLDIRQKGDNLNDHFTGKSTSHPIWHIFLSRKGECRNLISIESKILLGVYKPYSQTLVFNSTCQSSYIGAVNWESIVDYRLDVVLVFEERSSTKGTSDDSCQISKLNKLSNDMKSMLAKEPFSDVTVKCNSFTMKVHKNVLSARSPVFEAMFARPVQDGKEDTVVIEDMDPEVCRTMLTFIYCGQIKNLTKSKIINLLKAADNYQIADLKCGCVEYLRTIMSDENVLQILEAADLHDKDLKLDANSFIRNRFNQLKSTQDWDSFKSKNPLLALEVYCNLDENQYLNLED